MPTIDVMARDSPTAAVQDYLKAIYRVEEDSGRLWVSTSELASSLGVSAPSASAMLKRLSGLGYVVAGERRGAFALTSDGRVTALEVVRRHRLLETFLVQHLGVPLAEVHHEAEILEHHISVALELRIADVLGNPDRDPHGDPIPTKDGKVESVAGLALSLAELKHPYTIVRVLLQDAERLIYLGAMFVLWIAVAAVVLGVAGGAGLFSALSSDASQMGMALLSSIGLVALVLAAAAMLAAVVRQPAMRQLGRVAGSGLVAVGVLFVVQLYRLADASDVSMSDLLGVAPFAAIVGGVTVLVAKGR